MLRNILRGLRLTTKLSIPTVAAASFQYHQDPLTIQTHSLKNQCHLSDPFTVILHTSRGQIDATIALCNQLICAYHESVLHAVNLTTEYTKTMQTYLEVIDASLEDNLVEVRCKWHELSAKMDSYEAALESSIATLRSSITTAFNMGDLSKNENSLVEHICIKSSESLHSIEEDYQKLRTSRNGLSVKWVEAQTEQIRTSMDTAS